MVDYNDSLERDKPSNSDAPDSKKTAKRRGLSKAQVHTRFTSCGRCSYFLVGYKIENGEQALDEAITSSEGNWLALPWTPNLSYLILKSFGYRLDANVYFFESVCPECRGKYKYVESQEGGLAKLFFKI